MCQVVDAGGVPEVDAEGVGDGAAGAEAGAGPLLADAAADSPDEPASLPFDALSAPATAGAAVPPLPPRKSVTYQPEPFS